jgi:hypothetical protein
MYIHRYYVGGHGLLGGRPGALRGVRVRVARRCTHLRRDPNALLARNLGPGRYSMDADGGRCQSCNRKGVHRCCLNADRAARGR